MIHTARLLKFGVDAHDPVLTNPELIELTRAVEPHGLVPQLWFSWHVFVLMCLLDYIGSQIVLVSFCPFASGSLPLPQLPIGHSEIS